MDRRVKAADENEGWINLIEARSFDSSNSLIVEYRMDLELHGRRVLVTGGSQGIGFAVAQGFLREGAAVTIVSRDRARSDAAVSALAANPGGKVEGRIADIAQRGIATALADACRDTDILVNNAGAIPVGDLFSIDETRWREAWELKVFGYINLMRAMYGHMRGKPPKVIVNVLGLGGERPQWNYGCGNAANTALGGVTKSLGGRSIDDGIRVVGVNPGGVETERMVAIQKARAARELGDEARWRDYYADKPLRRAATPDKVANVILFLASARASWVSGAVVPVDGGFLHRESWF